MGVIIEPGDQRSPVTGPKLSPVVLVDGRGHAHMAVRQGWQVHKVPIKKRGGSSVAPTQWYQSKR